MSLLHQQSVGCHVRHTPLVLHPKPASGLQRQPVKARAQPAERAVPEVGWMWDMSSGKAAATRASLKSANIKAKKSLGQNFCTDDKILANIVGAAGVTADDLVMEVGPGTGNLTRHLIATGAQVVAVEKDDTLVDRLRQEFAEVDNVHLIHGDVLRLNMDDLIADLAQRQQDRRDSNTQASSSSSSEASSSSSRSSSNVAGKARRPARVKVVANLPYNITKDFLRALLPRGQHISQLSIMIQEEVAQRLVRGMPRQKDYRSMSVFTRFYSRPVYHFLIPKEKYFPVPGVDGALVTFHLKPEEKRLKVPSERSFIKMVEKAFSERRKMMRNSLAPLYSSKECEAAFMACGLRPDIRAQDLNLEQFVLFFQQLHQQREAAAAAAADDDDAAQQQQEEQQRPVQ